MFYQIFHGNDLRIIEISVAVVTAIALIVLIVRYKFKGLLSAISYVGLVALLLLTIRYANVMLSIEGILAVLVVLILNYIFTNKLLSLMKTLDKKEAIKQTYKNFFIRTIPIIIMSIVFCFISWTAINTFGMVMFWGITLIALYNFIVTGTLLKLQNEEPKKDKKPKTKKTTVKKEDKSKTKETAKKDKKTTAKENKKPANKKTTKKGGANNGTKKDNK